MKNQLFFGEWMNENKEIDLFDPVEQAATKLMVARSFLADLNRVLAAEPKALKTDRDRYLQWVKQPVAERLAATGLSVDDDLLTIYQTCNAAGHSVRDGIILCQVNAYIRHAKILQRIRQRPYGRSQALEG